MPIISENDFLALIQKRERELKNISSPPAGDTTKAENPKATVKADPTPYKQEPVTRKMEGMQGTAAPKAVSRDAMEDQLWVDKYKPSSLNDVIGSSDTVKKLTDWLRRWNDMHVTKTFKPPFMKENPGAKAALLSGPPGIGMFSCTAVHRMIDLIFLFQCRKDNCCYHRGTVSWIPGTGNECFRCTEQEVYPGGADGCGYVSLDERDGVRQGAAETYYHG